MVKSVHCLYKKITILFSIHEGQRHQTQCLLCQCYCNKNDIFYTFVHRLFWQPIEAFPLVLVM